MVSITPICFSWRETTSRFSFGSASCGFPDAEVNQHSSRFSKLIIISECGQHQHDFLGCKTIGYSHGSSLLLTQRMKSGEQTTIFFIKLKSAALAMVALVN
jgi:hypothetical protein